MTFEIEIAGRTHRVSIERSGDAAGTYRISVDGRAYHADVRRSGEVSLSLLVRGTVPLLAAERGTVPLFSSQEVRSFATNDAETDHPERGTVPLSREVVVAPGAGGEVLVTLGGYTVAATVNARRTGRAATAAGAHADGEQVIVAPMPGRVVRVLVKPGDDVTARQGVVVVEAMKMENELRSPKAGRVKDVQVTAGASVEAGRILIVIE